MTDPGPFLLVVVSCLGMHVLYVMVIVAHYRVLPADWLERFWRASSSRSRPPAWERWIGNVIGALFLAIPTGLMVFAILRPERAGGGFGVLSAVLELALATAWTGYLLLGARGPRAW
jgi:hypothetical protein